MIQSTIYHLREYGKNLYDPEERNKFYSDDFLNNIRHINPKVEQELEEFKIEINEKLEHSKTKFYMFPRPRGQDIYLNTDSNIMDISHSHSQFHQLPNYDAEQEEFYDQ